MGGQHECVESFSSGEQSLDAEWENIPWNIHGGGVQDRVGMLAAGQIWACADFNHAGDENLLFNL